MHTLKPFQFYFRGSAIAKIIGHNVIKHSGQFDSHVSMWVFEEMIDGRKLTEIINETHENVKYLPNHKLPANVVSMISFSIYGSKAPQKISSLIFHNVGCSP